LKLFVEEKIPLSVLSSPAVVLAVSLNSAPLSHPFLNDGLRREDYCNEQIVDDELTSWTGAALIFTMAIKT